jgi:hypothetical protein
MLISPAVTPTVQRNMATNPKSYMRPGKEIEKLFPPYSPRQSHLKIKHRVDTFVCHGLQVTGDAAIPAISLLYPEGRRLWSDYKGRVSIIAFKRHLKEFSNRIGRLLSVRRFN